MDIFPLRGKIMGENKKGELLKKKKKQKNENNNNSKQHSTLVVCDA